MSAQHALKALYPNVDGDAAQAIADFIATMCQRQGDVYNENEEI